MKLFHLEKVLLKKTKIEGHEVLAWVASFFRGWAGNSEVEGQRP